MSNMPENKQRLAQSLLDCKCFLSKDQSPEGQGFRLKLHEKNPDAPLSPLYINLRLLQSFPGTLQFIAEMFAEVVDEQDVLCDCVAGIPTAGVPIATAFSLASGIPMITPRLEAKKDHGLKATIDGVCESGANALVVDDLITKAGSKFEAIEALEHAGLLVTDVMVIVDRGQGGAEELKKLGYDLHSLITLNEMLDYYLTTGAISDALYQEIAEYIANNK